jgi:hypothetical protein
MNHKVKHIRKSVNKFWKNPKSIIVFAILLLGSGFTCGIYFQKTESNLEAIKVCSEYNNTLNEERNKHAVDVFKYENEITLLKQKE